MNNYYYFFSIFLLFIIIYTRYVPILLSRHNKNMSYLREKENMNNLYEFFLNFLIVLDQGLLISRSLHHF